jgi:hypothetical protein
MTARILEGSLMGLPLVFFDLVALRAVSFREELLHVRGVRKGERDVAVRRLKVVSRVVGARHGESS